MYNSHREANYLGRIVEITEGISHNLRLLKSPYRLKPIYSDKASRSADTTSREAGKDIEAKRGSRELWVSVKGWAEKSVNTQARHWFAAVLFDLVLYRTDNPSVDLAIGIPDGFSTYENLLPRIRWRREKIPFNVFKVSESGDVSVLHPES